MLVGSIKSASLEDNVVGVDNPFYYAFALRTPENGSILNPLSYLKAVSAFIAEIFI